MLNFILIMNLNLCCRVFSWTQGKELLLHIWCLRIDGPDILFWTTLRSELKALPLRWTPQGIDGTFSPNFPHIRSKVQMCHLQKREIFLSFHIRLHYSIFKLSTDHFLISILLLICSSFMIWLLSDKFKLLGKIGTKCFLKKVFNVISLHNVTHMEYFFKKYSYSWMQTLIC